MHIAIGADHRGFEHKEYIKQHASLYQMHIQWHNVGAFNDERSDYPEFVKSVCDLVLQGKVERGILLCGSGVGMSIAANRFAGIYAGLVWSTEVARMSRADDNTNVLVLPADFVTAELSVEIIKGWLETEFKNGRYKQRLEMIDRFGHQK